MDENANLKDPLIVVGKIFDHFSLSHRKRDLYLNHTRAGGM